MLVVAAFIISVFALAVSFASALYAKRSSAAAEEANTIARERQTADEEREQATQASALKANVRVLAELRRNRRGAWHILAKNDGPATATDLALEITASSQSVLDLLAGPDRDADKAELGPGETWELFMNNVSGQNCPIEGHIRWQDDTSQVEPFRIVSAADQPPFVDSPTAG